MNFMNYKSFLSAFFLAGAFLFWGCSSNSDSSSTDVTLESQIDSVSYSQGFQVGNFLKQQNMTDINTDKLVAGINTALNNEEPQLTGTEMQQVVRAYQRVAQKEAQKERLQEAKENAEQGKKFLAENKNKEGVQVTDSGLQYRVMQEGSGATPDTTDTVRVHYKGTLIDGTVFDSSYERGQPAQFPVNRVIPGWTEGLHLMQEGAKYKFWIPSDLAYGQNPRQGSPIGPNETLIFEVELLEVNPSGSSN